MLQEGNEEKGAKRGREKKTNETKEHDPGRTRREGSEKGKARKKRLKRKTMLQEGNEGKGAKKGWEERNKCNGRT